MKQYESPIIETIELVDVITTSGNGNANPNPNPDELPDDEF